METNKISFCYENKEGDMCSMTIVDVTSKGYVQEKFEEFLKQCQEIGEVTEEDGDSDEIFGASQQQT